MVQARRHLPLTAAPAAAVVVRAVPGHGKSQARSQFKVSASWDSGRDRRSLAGEGGSRYFRDLVTFSNRPCLMEIALLFVEGHLL